MRQEGRERKEGRDTARQIKIESEGRWREGGKVGGGTIDRMCNWISLVGGREIKHLKLIVTTMNSLTQRYTYHII